MFDGNMSDNMSDNWFGNLFNPNEDDDVVVGTPNIPNNLVRPRDLDDESDEEVQKPSIKDKLFSYISNLGSYTDFMSGFSDTFGFQEEVYEVNIKEFDKCDDVNNVPPNSKIVGIFDNQCVWLDDNNEIKTTDYNKDTLLDENKNTTNTNEGNAENELSDELKDLRNKINGIELTDKIKGSIKIITTTERINNKIEWENKVKNVLHAKIKPLLTDTFNIDDSKYKLMMVKDKYYKNIYDKLENIKTDTEIIDAIKEYFINNLPDIQDKVTKYKQN